MNKNLYELQREAKKVAGILKINCPEIVYDEDEERADCTQVSETGDFCILLNPGLDYNLQLSIVIRLVRMKWSERKFSLSTVEDACCFEAGYRMYLRKEIIHEFFSGDLKVDIFVNSYIWELQNQVALFGNGYEERCAWLADARSGMFDY